MSFALSPDAVDCGTCSLVRRADGTPEELSDGRVRLWAESTYVLRPGRGWDGGDLSGVVTMPPGASEGHLRFGNYVGEARIGTRRALIESDRLDASAVVAMHERVVSDLATLPLSFDKPVSMGWTRDLIGEPDVLYLAFVFVRAALTTRRPHDLPEAMERILARPLERIGVDRVDLPLELADRIDGQSIHGLLSRPDRLHALPPGHPLSSSPAARALRMRIPARVVSARAVATFNTRENRFVLAALKAVVGVVSAFEQAMQRRSGPGPAATRREARALATTVEQWMRHPVFEGLQPLAGMPLNSTVLRRRPGYRAVTRFVLDLVARTRALSSPSASNLVDARDAASVYEAWCYLSLVDAVVRVTGKQAALQPTIRDVDTAWLPFGARASVGTTSVWFNRTFSPGAGRWSSYSRQMRPDIVLEGPAGKLHAFDAKLRLEGVSSSAGDDERSYKPDDLHKMHAYRDALGISSVWVLFPGAPSGEVEFPAERHRAVGDGEPMGVGAIPLRPGRPSAALDRVIGRILEPEPRVTGG